MKNFKQIFLALVAVFAAVLLVACGLKSDNGTYVFEPSTEEVRQMLPSQLAYIITDDYKFRVSIIIKDKEGVATAEAEEIKAKLEEAGASITLK